MMLKILKKVFRRDFPAKLRAKIKRKLVMLVSDIFAKSYSEDPNYRLDLVEKGFEDRKSHVKDDAMFVRIIEAYNKAKEKQSGLGSAYQVGNEWLPIYEHDMKEIMSALKARSVPEVSKIYNNFFREPCSLGLHGLPLDMFKRYFAGKISRGDKKFFLRDVLYRYELWKRTVGKTLSNDVLDSPMTGNPYGFYIDGKFIKAGSDYLHYYASLIGSLVRANERSTVMELGGGYGGLAYYLVRDNAEMTYVDFDLPENLALTSFYLMSAFPNKRIGLYGEVDLKSSDLKDRYDIVLLPNFAIADMKNDSADLMFNSYSLAEMSREAIENYLVHFNRVTRKYIFHVNHNRESVVRADEFKIDLDKFEFASRSPALWNKGMNLLMDEFEYLYKNKRLKATF